MCLIVRSRGKELWDDPGINDLLKLQKIMLGLSEDNYAESWNTIKEMGYMTQDRHESLVMITIRANITGSSKKEDVYARFLIDLSKDIDIRKYLRYYINSNRKSIKVSFAKKLEGKPLLLDLDLGLYKDDSDLILPIIMNDDIEMLKNLMMDPEFDVFKAEIRENYLSAQYRHKILPRTCYYGALNCFKHLFILLKEEKIAEELEACKRSAIHGGNVEIIHLLEQNTIQYDKESILHAIEANNSEIFDWLVEKFHGIIRKDDVIEMCIRHVFLHGIFQIEVLNYLYLLPIIVERDFYELFKYIIIECEHFSDDLMKAVSRYGSDRATKLLFEVHSGECLNIFSNYALYAVQNNRTTFVKCGIAAGFSPNIRFRSSGHIIDVAIEHGDDEMIEAIVNHPNVKVPDVKTITAAWKMNKLYAVKLLLDKPGVDIKKFEEELKVMRKTYPYL